MNKTKRMAVLEHRRKAKKAKLKRQTTAPASAKNPASAKSPAPAKTAAPAVRAKK